MNRIHGSTVIAIANDHTQGDHCAGAIAAAGNTKKAVHQGASAAIATTIAGANAS
jgi:hypothetical protein